MTLHQAIPRIPALLRVPDAGIAIAVFGINRGRRDRWNSLEVPDQVLD
jgi:hypothetical protein